MRAAVRNLILANSTLVAAIPPERWYAPGAVVDTPVKPFAVLRWLAPVQSAARGSFLRQLRVDVHDNRGSYVRIQQILGSPDKNDGVYGVFSQAFNHVGTDGRITEMNFLGHSGDQEDDVYKTNFMFSSWQVIGVDL